MFFVANINAQSHDEVYREANPEQTVQTDNSPYANLLAQIANAKKAGNFEQYKQLSEQLKSQFPEKFHYSQDAFQIRAQYPEGNMKAPFIEGDWGPGDVRLYPRNVFTGNARNNKTLDLEVDSLGNKYAAFIVSTRDSIKLYKSTNDGTIWTNFQTVIIAAPLQFHSFDMFITDSANAFRIGISCAVNTIGSENDGQLFWISMTTEGTGFRAASIYATPAGSGYANPSITSDGFLYSAGLTYWYTAYQRVNSGTGAGNQLLCSFSTDWGWTWRIDTVRNTFNDFSIDIEYNSYPTADSIYVIMTNDVTPANPNLRLMRVWLGILGNSPAWTQFNINASAQPELECELAVNRQNNGMAIVFREDFGAANGNARYNYWVPGLSSWWGNTADISANPNNESRPRIDCQERQGAYRVSFVSQDVLYDTVIYTSTTDITSGFAGRTIVNQTNDGSTIISPDVAGFRSGGGFGGGVTFAGFSSSVWYDGSNITPTGINPNNGIVEQYTLSQNYPNPFNPVTNIKFSLPVKGFASLVVYDALGREVATLINSELNAGSYTVDFNASSLSSGVYFYKLTANNFSDVKKMLLVK